jgi:hypothetical protein
MDTLQTTVKPAGNGGFDPSARTPVPTVSLASTAAMPRRSVDPHLLAHKRSLSKAARAVLGAEILDGNLPLMNPTIGMVALAVGVSAGSISRAKQLSPEARREVARGNRPLLQPKPPAPVLSVEQRFTNIVVELGGIAPALDALAAVGRRNGNGNGA